MEKQTHQGLLSRGGADLLSPVSGSMRPLVREKRDYCLFQPLGRPPRRYDVVLYRSGAQTRMHRVVEVLPGAYRLRGDNAVVAETVGAEAVFGIMAGVYRDARYIPCKSLGYRLYSRLIVLAHPLIRRGRTSKGLFWRMLRRVRRALRKARQP